MREIEIKAKVTNKQNIIDDLAKLGVSLSEPKKQHDIVFCKPGQIDHAEGSIWLRIRTEDDKKYIFTLKGDTGRKLDNIEHEVEVSDPVELEKMLRLMNMEVYSDLTKTRQKAMYQDVEICLDDVEGLGTYIELEKLFEDHATDSSAVIDELWSLFTQLGVKRSDEETNGYDVLMRQKQITNV